MFCKQVKANSFARCRIAPSRLRMLLLTQPKELKYLSVWVMVGFWCGISSDAAVALDHCDEEGAERFQSNNLRSNPYFWI